ncbi:uncharacterized protein LOC130744236 [Lotus japonicus]|uniref:uncharacterized protein LOC130744177 n=1 Tax=Lotus japonicus TaxID=34305 RepID=UPI002585B34C|nr:uncharacterized protein LOC130744177 [Lotus japonicus]XP_057452352.1 uncharacterized protein LOC130744178 [Lotus japonicus]XP_057452413.1 uncharacterized protein LOC130744236 [Lotus japonicus]
MKNKRASSARTGGPMRLNLQNQQEKGRLRQGKPYHRYARDNSAPGQHEPMVTALGEERGQVLKREVVCFACGEAGHFADKCKNRSTRCFRCHQPGHQAKDCEMPKAEPSVNTARGKRPATGGRVYNLNVDRAAGARN